MRVTDYFASQKVFCDDLTVEAVPDTVYVKSAPPWAFSERYWYGEYMPPGSDDVPMDDDDEEIAA